MPVKHQPIPSAPPPAKPLTARQISGARAEKCALDLLTRLGLRHVASNVRYRGGELDLVMREPGGPASGDVLVFVEVRSRASGAFGGAAASVDVFKQRKLIAAAEQYLQQHHPRHPPACRFDVVTVDGEGRAEWLRDAFQTG